MTPVSFDPDAVPEWLATLWPSKGRDSKIVAGVNDDDCAVVEWNDRFVIATTDFMNSRPIAVQLGLGGLQDVGRLLVAANLADLCSSGAEPRALLIGVMLERGTSDEEFRELMHGVRVEAARWGVPVVGGDTKLGPGRALVAVALGGAATDEGLFLKNRGTSGDLLWCSGPLGSCNAAVLGLTRHGMPADWQEWAKDSILIPKVPLAKSRALARARLGRAGIDVSDGLGADLKRMCLASHVGAVVDASQIPVENQAQVLAKAMEIEPWTLAFGCGGDFQFLVSTSPGKRELVESFGFTLIGELTDDRRLLIRHPDGTRLLPEGGHRDVRNMSFANEILSLVQAAGATREA